MSWFYLWQFCGDHLSCLHRFAPLPIRSTIIVHWKIVDFPQQGNQGSGMVQGWQYSFPNVEACVQFLWLGKVFCWVTYSVLSLNFSLDPFIYCKKCLIFNYVGLHQVWSAWFLASCTLPFMVHYMHGSQKLGSYQMHFRSVRSIKDPVLTSMHWV